MASSTIDVCVYDMSESKPAETDPERIAWIAWQIFGIGWRVDSITYGLSGEAVVACVRVDGTGKTIACGGRTELAAYASVYASLLRGEGDVRPATGEPLCNICDRARCACVGNFRRVPR